MDEPTAEEILVKAGELGRLIQETDVYRRYREMAAVLESDNEASKLLMEYEVRLGEIENRRRAGDIIEHFETEELKEKAMEVQEHGLLMEYLAAKQDYISLLERIQKSLVGDSDEEE